jgi:hypothetical protein
MMESDIKTAAEAAAAAVVELAIRWAPATGQLQVVGSNVDLVVKLGMMEMAKIALQNQTKPSASPVIVPGRFAS